MSQFSAFHDGFQFGDAKYYTAEDYHKILTQLYLGSGGYVCGTSSTYLEVNFSAGQNVVVTAGSAIVGGVYYTASTNVTITLDDSDGTLPRIDRIIVRVDWETQTARAVAKRGVASQYPVAPELVQEIGTLYEIPLAAAYIPAGFTGFGDDTIYDERQFNIKSDIEQEFNTGMKNLMFNSEFLSGPSNDIASIPFPMWRTTNGTTVDYSPTTWWIIYGIEGADQFSTQSRGRSVVVDFNATNGDFYTYLRLNEDSTKVATIAFMVRVIKGVVEFSVDGGSTTLYTLYPTSKPILVMARVFVSGPSFLNVPAIEPHFTGSAPDAQMKLGQVTVSFGYNPAPFESHSELVMCPNMVSMADSSGDAGNNSYDLDQDVFWNGMKNALVGHKYEDTSSSTQDSVYASIINSYSSTTDVDINRLEIGRLPNSVAKYSYATMGLELLYDDQWTVAADFAKAGTNTWNMYLIGIQT